MSFRKLASLTLALGTIITVSAQYDGTVIQIEAVKAHFAQSGLVPAVLPQFAPTAILSVFFKGLGNVSIGQPISRERAWLAWFSGTSPQLTWSICRGRV